MNDAPRFVKSSYCDAGSCVEVAVAPNGVLIRNSQKPEDVLALTKAQWASFLQMIGDDRTPL